jgi:hypothetical protein
MGVLGAAWGVGVARADVMKLVNMLGLDSSAIRLRVRVSPSVDDKVFMS